MNDNTRNNGELARKGYNRERNSVTLSREEFNRHRLRTQIQFIALSPSGRNFLRAYANVAYGTNLAPEKEPYYSTLTADDESVTVTIMPQVREDAEPYDFTLVNAVESLPPEFLPYELGSWFEDLMKDAFINNKDIVIDEIGKFDYIEEPEKFPKFNPEMEM